LGFGFLRGIVRGISVRGIKAEKWEKSACVDPEGHGEEAMKSGK